MKLSDRLFSGIMYVIISSLVCGGCIAYVFVMAKLSERLGITGKIWQLAFITIPIFFGIGFFSPLKKKEVDQSITSKVNE